MYYKVNYLIRHEWLSGAMVLGKLPIPGRPAGLDKCKSRARTLCACSRCGWGFFGHFSLICHISSFSLSVGDGLI